MPYLDGSESFVSRYIGCELEYRHCLYSMCLDMILNRGLPIDPNAFRLGETKHAAKICKTGRGKKEVGLSHTFDAFAKGSDEFVALLQATMEVIFPEVEYRVTSTDSIHFLVSIFH